MALQPKPSRQQGSRRAAVAAYPAGMEIAPRIRRLGEGLVNSYLVEDGGGVTIVDAGAPAYWNDLPAELAALGRSLSDVRSVVLTHGHSDHKGFAERIRSERNVPVRVHELDAALARGEVPNPARGFGPIRPRPLIGFIIWSIRHGMLRLPNIQAVATFGDGATLDVPGSPRVILVPGHTPGSAALHFAYHDALFVGDALATYSVATGRHGPQVAPFTADAAEAVGSLARLDEVVAALVLPGHGQAWKGGVAEALRRVRASTRAATAA
jgi:glyoxylase-like metal-dependent hydrolase (beta-lactamase superfamily II)